MSHDKLTHWIEDADARECRRNAVFLAHIEQKQYLHLGALAVKVAEWCHNTMTEDVLPALRHRSRSRD